MFVDPCNNDYSFPVGARGELSLRVNNSRKLLLKLVGTENGLTRQMELDIERQEIDNKAYEQKTMGYQLIKQSMLLNQ